LVPVFLLAGFSCKKTQENNPGPGNRLTMEMSLDGNYIFNIKKFHYSGNILDSVTEQNILENKNYVYRNKYFDGLLQEVSNYELIDQQFKPTRHLTVLQYSNGIPSIIQDDNYFGQDTVVQRIIYTYIYNIQGLVSQFNKFTLNGSAQTQINQTDFIYEGSNRKQVNTYYLLLNTGDMIDDYTWSGNHLLQNSMTRNTYTGWVNQSRYTYEYTGDRVSTYTFFQWDTTWQPIFSVANIYNANGNISEQINAPYSNLYRSSKRVFTYIQGNPLYRSFFLVSRPEWPIESPAIPTPP
jgi:hypothetical protein